MEWITAVVVAVVFVGLACDFLQRVSRNLKCVPEFKKCECGGFYTETWESGKGRETVAVSVAVNNNKAAKPTKTETDARHDALQRVNQRHVVTTMKEKFESNVVDSHHITSEANKANNNNNNSSNNNNNKNHIRQKNVIEKQQTLLKYFSGQNDDSPRDDTTKKIRKNTSKYGDIHHAANDDVKENQSPTLISTNFVVPRSARPPRYERRLSVPKQRNHHRLSQCSLSELLDQLTDDCDLPLLQELCHELNIAGSPTMEKGKSFSLQNISSTEGAVDRRPDETIKPFASTECLFQTYVDARDEATQELWNIILRSKNFKRAVSIDDILQEETLSRCLSEYSISDLLSNIPDQS